MDVPGKPCPDGMGTDVWLWIRNETSAPCDTSLAAFRASTMTFGVAQSAIAGAALFGAMIAAKADARNNLVVNGLAAAMGALVTLLPDAVPTFYTGSQGLAPLMLFVAFNVVFLFSVIVHDNVMQKLVFNVFPRRALNASAWEGLKAVAVSRNAREALMRRVSFGLLACICVCNFVLLPLSSSASDSCGDGGPSSPSPTVCPALSRESVCVADSGVIGAGADGGGATGDYGLSKGESDGRGARGRPDRAVVRLEMQVCRHDAKLRRIRGTTT